MTNRNDYSSGRRPSQVFADRLRTARVRKGWTSQQQVADALGALGHRGGGGRPLDRSAIARIENGKRSLQLDEAFALAAALEISPLSLALPHNPDELVALAPALTVSAGEARSWARGDEPLPGQDRRFFEEESPEFWVDVLTLRNQGVLYRLTGELAQASQDEDTRTARKVLDALQAEVDRQREELKKARGRKPRQTKER